MAISNIFLLGLPSNQDTLTEHVLKYQSGHAECTSSDQDMRYQGISIYPEDLP